MHVERLDTLAGIDRTAWDAIAPSVRSTHGWLSTVEETVLGGLEPRYLVARDGGRLLAAIPYCVMGPNPVHYTVDHHLLGRAQAPAARLGLSFLPALLCGPFHGDGGHFLLDPGLSAERREEAISALMAELAAVARERRCSMFFNHVPERERAFLLRCRRAGFFDIEAMPVAALELRGGDFDAYVEQVREISAGAARAIRNEVNRFRKSGAAIEVVERPEEVEDRLHQLMVEQYARLGARPYPFRRDFFTVLQRRGGRSVTTYVCRHRGAITGVVSLIVHGAQAVLTNTGIDHSTGPDFTYFNLVYYRPIADALAAGCRRIDFGASAYQAKRRRGCAVERTFLLYRPAEGLAAPAARALGRLLSAYHRWSKARILESEAGPAH